MMTKIMKIMSKYNKSLISELYSQHKTITDVAKSYARAEGIEYTDTLRRAVSRVISTEDIDDNFENETSVDTNQYSMQSPLSALKQDGTVMSIDEYCSYYNIPVEHVKSYKLVTHTGKGAYYNIASSDIRVDYLKDFKKDLLDAISNLPKLPKTNEENKSKGGTGELLVISLADVHIGKLSELLETGDEYNSEIAVRRVLTGVDQILRDASGVNIEQILLVGGNDILHTDNAKRTTTSGTPQDTDGGWYTNFLKAKQMYIKVIEMLRKVARVHFVHNPSNHDFVTGTLLVDCVATYFKDCQDFTIDIDLRHRKYYKYYQNLIGTTHGDGAKTSELPLLMAHEAADYWASSVHRYFYTHHVHHKNEKDYVGVTVESFRSVSGTDGWHDRNGFKGAPKALEAFVHHPSKGRRLHFVHIF
jgi:hypothetical protein